MGMSVMAFLRHRSWVFTPTKNNRYRMQHLMSCLDSKYWVQFNELCGGFSQLLTGPAIVRDTVLKEASRVAPQCLRDVKAIDLACQKRRA